MSPIRSRRPRLVLFLLPLLLAPACAAGPDPAPDEHEVLAIHHTGEDCICGTPRGNLLGCHCEDCLLHGGNPDNPDCTCLPLRATDETLRISASFGPGTDGIGPAAPQGGLIGLDVIKLERERSKRRGEVIADDTLSIRFRGEDGTESTFAYEELDRVTVYKLLKARTSKDDGAAELRLATYARDCGLFAHARRHYGYALDADPELADEVEAGLAELRHKAARSELDAALAAFRDGDERVAREHVLLVLREFPDEPEASEAAAMLNELNVRSLGAEQARLVASLAAESVRALEAVASDLNKAEEANREALGSTKTTSQAVRRYEQALRDAAKAVRELDRLEERSRGDTELARAAAAYRERIAALQIEIHVNLASLYLVDGELEDAAREVSRALAIDPEHSGAKELRARIEAARDSYDEGYREGYQQGQRSDNDYYGYWPYRAAIVRRRHGVGYRSWGGRVGRPSVGFR
jgi:tetratricopeptide (TPR) repeat protein